MEWALTLNRHRLYDTWAEESGKLQYTHRNINWGHQISNIAFEVLGDPSYHTPETGLGTLIAFGGCIVAAGVVSICEVINFLDLCNISMAFSLWCAVKVYSLATSLLFPEVNDLDAQDKQILFLTADYLEIDQLAPFLQLYSHEVRVEYLKEAAHPERLQRFLEWYHGCHAMPEKWEDAIYSVGLSIKKLSLDDGAHLRVNFRKLVKWFPNLTELTITDRSFDLSSIEALQTLRHLQKLHVAHIAGEVNYTKMYECLQSLHWLKELKMPLGQVTADTLTKFAELMPDLHTLAMTDCSSELTEGHVGALKSMKCLEKLTIEGDFTWQNGKALSDLQGLNGLTHLTILPKRPSNSITSLNVPDLCDMPKLECVQFNHLPIDTRALEKMAENCSQLRRVELKWCNSFSAAALKSFKKLSFLEELLLQCQGIDDEAIAHIATVNGLKKLSLYTHVQPLSDQALTALGKCSTLHTLCLSETHIATNGLKSISEGCNALETLVLDGSQLLEDRDMIHRQTLTKLRELSVNHCSKLGNKAVEKISKIATLTSLSATQTKVTSASWKYWSTHPTLESLTMWCLPHQGLFHSWPIVTEVRELPEQLRALDIRSAEYLDLDVLLERCPNLVTLHPGKNLSIKGAPTDNAVLPAFQRLSKLKHLHLEAINFTPGYHHISGYRSDAAEAIEGLIALPGMQQVYVNASVQEIYRLWPKELPAGLTVIQN